MEACVLSVVPAYSGGWGRRIVWAQEVEVSVSQDHTTALQPRQQNEILSHKNKKWPGVVAHACNPALWEAKVGGSPEVRS